MEQLDKLILNLIHEQKLMCSGVARAKTDLGRAVVPCPNTAIGYRWSREGGSTNDDAPVIIAWCKDHEIDLRAHDKIEITIDDQAQDQDYPEQEEYGLNICPHIAAAKRMLQEQHVTLASTDDIMMICKICNDGGVIIG